MVTIVKRAADVRVQEINLSQVAIARSSAVGCIPIVSRMGSPFPRRFTTPSDFTFEYGESNPSISMSIACAMDFFTEGSDLWALRVVGAGAKYSAVLLYVDGGVTKLHSVTTGIADPDNIDWAAINPVPGSTSVALFYPSRGQGSYGDDFAIRVSSGVVSAPATTSVVSTTTGGTLPAATYQYRVSAISREGETLVTNPAEGGVSGVSVTNAITFSWSAVEGAIGYKVYGRTGGAGLLATLGGATLSFVDTGAIVADVTKQPITNPANVPTPSSLFTVSVFDNTVNASVPLETHDCTLAYMLDGSGAQSELEDRINPFSQYIRVQSNAAALVTLPLIGNVAKTSLDGGDSGSAPTSTDIVNAMQVFRDKQQYKVNIFINAGFADPIVQRGLDAIAQFRGDAVALLDMPANKQRFQDAIDYRNLELNLNSTYSALFSPDILEADFTNGRQLYVPFSGYAAALLARTDRVSDPSRSPAGLNRGQVNHLKQRYTYDDAQASALFDAQVNYLRTLSGAGMALWEQQTLANQFSALSWLNVRRITNVVKVATYDYLLYALQEPNSDALKRSIVEGLSSYLQVLKNNDALSDFSVVCDATNNPAAVANAAILVVTVIIVPMLAVHEVQLQMVISKQGVSFKEVLSKVGN